jgi:hypothetical protein
MIESPILIIGCPRSGTTLLYNILSELPTLWSLGYESKTILERYHHPAVKNWESGALTAEDLTPISRDYLLTKFEQQSAPGSYWQRVNQVRSFLRNNLLWKRVKKQGRTQQTGAAMSSALPQKGLDILRWPARFYHVGGQKRIRFLEKTPENCLRLPFLLALFPDARIIYLTRDGRHNVYSLMEGWQQPHTFPGYQVPEKLNIPGDKRGRWAFSLIPGWRDLKNSPLEEICAWQWVRCNEAVLDFQAKNRDIPCFTVQYEALVADPGAILPQLADFVGVAYEPHLSRFAHELPPINAVSAPEREKWRRSQEQIERIFPIVEPMMKNLGY